MNPIRDEWTTEDGSIRLLLGDCLEILPGLDRGSVSATMTSPPYNTLPQKNKPSGLHAQRKSGVNQWISKAVDSYADAMPEHEYQEWLISILEECRRATSGLLWVNHKIRYREGIAIHPARMFPWPIYSEVIWDRQVSMALNCKRYAPSTEHLLGFGLPDVWNDENNGLMSVWRIGFDRDDNEHPCAYPVELASRPIESSTNPASTILDPFMGSGTTGVACIRLGRRFIGIEKEPRYFEIAKRRIRNELDKTRLIEPPKRLIQTSFAEATA